MIEAQHGREVFGQPAQDHPGDVRAEGNIRPAQSRKVTAKMTPAKNTGAKTTAHEAITLQAPESCRNADIGTRALTASAAPSSR